jgi:general secretion pathway protein K
VSQSPVCPPFDTYRDAGRLYAPRHGLFRTLDELRLVLGMTDELYQSVLPLITVYSQSAEIDRQVASDGVLAVFAVMGDQLAQSQQHARDRGQASGVDRRPAMGEALTIRARLTSADLVMPRTAVVRIAGDRREPYWVLSWR